MERRSRFNTIALLLLILFAAAVRFYRLSAQDIWGDEAFSIFLSQQPLGAVVAGGADTHPPLYPLLLFLWMPLVGASAFATRALSALIGILIVPLIFVLAKRLTDRSRVAWFAALLAAFSPLLIYYSQETRMYELVTVLSLASAYFCLTLFPAQGERGREYFVSTLLAMYTHYSAFFVLAAENIFALWRWWQNRREWGRAWLRDWLLVQAFLVVCYVPWIVVQTSFLSGKANHRFDEWGWRGIEMIFGKTFLSFSAGLTAEFPVAQITTLIFLIVAALGTMAMIQRREARGGFALLYFAVPVMIAYVLNPVMPFFFERYVLVALPGFILLVAWGLDVLAQKKLATAIGVAIVLLSTSALSLYNYFYNDAYAKGQYGHMMAYVSDHVQPGDALILSNPLQKPLYQYYTPRGIPAFFLPDGVPLEDPSSRAQLEEIASTHSRVWLVLFGNPAEYDPTGYLERWLGANAFRTWRGGFVDAELSLYVMPSKAAPVQQSLQVKLGEAIRLTGYELDRAEVVPGQTIQLTLHWQTTGSIATRYKVFTHLIGGINPATQSPVWAQMDSEPAGGSRATTTWQAGETIDDRYGLLAPQNIPAGDYFIEVGMYDPATVVRLPVFDANGERVADDRIILGTVRVLAR